METKHIQINPNNRQILVADRCNSIGLTAKIISVGIRCIDGYHTKNIFIFL